MATKFQEAADLLRTKGGNAHSKDDLAEKAAFQAAWKTFDEVIALVPAELKMVVRHSWQNSGAITKYAWLMFCTEPYFDVLRQSKLKNLKILPLTLSFFCNQNGAGDYGFRVCLELKHEAISSKQLKDYYKLLGEITPIEGLTTFDENTDKRLPESETPFSNDFFKSLSLEDGDKFFSVGFWFPIEDDDALKEDIKAAFTRLLPMYTYIMEKCDKRAGEGSASSANAPSPTVAGTAAVQPEPTFPKNLVFYGAPGTGKTYRTVNQAVAICLKKSLAEIDAMPREDLTAQYRDLVDKGNISFVTFHQSYSYEDFVIGIFPELTRGATGAEGTLKYIPKNGIFKTICDTARNEPDTNFVLIIDEINRGNISKIFGELITLIEDSKREGQPEATTVLLPYMDDKNINRFSVPNNVYIIGTMNTADRSIQHVDTALRRRFVFEEALPDSSLFKGIDITAKGQKVNVADLLDMINRRIKRYFDREHVIGHAYLMPLREPGLTDDQKLQVLGAIFHDRIIPLLQDYFFEDYSKIQKVLGEDPETEDSTCLIRKVKEGVYDGDDEGRDVYEVAPAGDPAYTNIETYKLMAE